MSWEDDPNNENNLNLSCFIIHSVSKNDALKVFDPNMVHLKRVDHLQNESFVWFLGENYVRHNLNGLKDRKLDVKIASSI